MFSSIVHELRPERRVTLLGDHLHGWLIEQVAARDSVLANRLHPPRQPDLTAEVEARPRLRGRPFSVCLMAATGGQATHLLRVSSIDPELSAMLPELGANLPRLSFGGTSWERRVPNNGPAHPLSGHILPADLVRRWSSSQPAISERVTFNFLSPTAFSRGRGELRSVTLFPAPDLVFRSLVETWNAYVWPLPEPDVAALLATVRERTHDIRTAAPVRLSEHKLTGFVGRCTYSCLPAAPESARRLLHLLADFAFFAGVGMKRTMGMGQTVVAHK